MARLTGDALNERRRERYRNDPWPAILREARNRAGRKNVEFTITRDDFTIPQFCPYLGVPLWEPTDDGGFTYLNQPSLDRIDPCKGYIPGNVQVISLRANRAKSDLTPDELRTFARSVLRMEGEQWKPESTSSSTDGDEHVFSLPTDQTTSDAPRTCY